jgi:hypothetical protein
MSSMTMKRAKRQLLRLVSEPCELDTFVQRAARKRRRPIHVLDVDFSAEGGITGAWKPTPQYDLIFVASSATGLLRVAIVCHEISHIWLNHLPEDLGFVGQDGLETVLPALLVASPELVSKFVRFRHDYGSEAEADAEYLATTVMSAIGNGVPQGRAQRVASSLLW